MNTQTIETTLPALMNDETNTEDTTATHPLFSESNSATYCPEDNKLRLYVGRVPRPEYLALKADGWTSTPKQDCDFVATWTPSRRDTAENYAGIIEDEDQSPEDRAADRAERFAGYLDKRAAEATGHADRYDSGPAFHGYQDKGRAARAADRHDRIATRATDAWEKAEYWQRRTAGVIGHALYKSEPGVRMGRIKELETSLRRCVEAIAEGRARWQAWKHIESITEPGEQTAAAIRYTGGSSAADHGFMHPRAETQTNAYYRENKTSLYSLLTCADPITGAEACALYFGRYSEPGDSTEWSRHLELRLAYENQMLEAQGGRAGEVEMIPGGWLIGGRRLSQEARQIVKVNKSPVTGRVISVLVRDNHASSRNIYGNPYPNGETRILSHTVKVERAGPDCYRAPTPEELAAFNTKEKAAKKARKETAPAPIPLINPTDDDAERLQIILNEQAKESHCARHLKAYGRDYAAEFKPSTVCQLKQATYSEASKGSYPRAETRGLCRDAELEPRASNMYCSQEVAAKKRRGPAICQIRTTGSDGSAYGARRVIVITDKPQKPLPLAVWESAPVVTESELVTA